MSNRVVELAVRIAADVAGDVGDKISGVGDSAVRMADDVESSSQRGGAGLERMGGAADGLDDKFGRASGAAGALASGADLIGNEKASAALNAMALATDFFSGVGQVGILVTEGLSAAAAENVVVSKAAAIASKGWAIAQGALNAVMSANPVALVVLGVVALVAAVVLAYKHSETFRTVVQAAMKGATTAVKWVVDAVGDVVTWLGRVASKFGFVGDVIHAYVFVAKTEIGLIVDVIKFVVSHVDDIGHAFSAAKDTVVSVANSLRDKAGGAFRLLLAPIRTVKDAIQGLLDLVDNLIDKISHIHIPHVDLNPFNSKGPGTTAGRSGLTGTGAVQVDVTVDMPVQITLPTSGDPQTAAAAIVAALKQLADRLGISVADLIRTELAT